MLWVTRQNLGAGQTSVLFGHTAFYKAREDYAADLLAIGAQPLDMFMYYYRDEPDDVLDGRLDGMLAGFRYGDVLIIQMPFFIRPLNIKRLIEKIHDVYHGQVIAFIHDFEPLRQKSMAAQDQDSDPWLDQYSYRTYGVLYPLFDALIVNNDRVAAALREYLHYTKPIISQGPFGYHTADHIPAPHFAKKLVFAGAFIKAGYLQHLPADCPIDVFGANPPDEFNRMPNVHYRGDYPPAELPSQLNSGFGLVWDSTDFPAVTGELGEYTRLSYAQKISLYLAARLPVIIWREAAGAEWLTANGVGLAIDNLAEAWPLIDSFDEARYGAMQARLGPLSQLIREGVYVKQAALRAYATVNTQSSDF